MRCAIELVYGACEYVEESILRQHVSNLYEVMNHATNVETVVRSMDSVIPENLLTLSRSYEIVIEERIIPILSLLFQSELASRLNRLTLALNKFIRVYLEKTPIYEGSCDSIMHYAFSISRSHCAANRIYGIELAAAACRKMSSLHKMTSHLQRFVDEWKKGDKQFDVGTRIGQIGLVVKILKDSELLPYLKASLVAEIHRFILKQLSDVGYFDFKNSRIRICAESAYSTFMISFPEMKGPDKSSSRFKQ
jgi:hypothetical protein